MDCNECRHAVVRGESAEEASINAHVAACGLCTAWREQEMMTMGQLQQAGAAWRERGMADEVVARVPVAKRSAVAGRIARFAAAAAVLAVAAGGVYIAAGPTPASAMQIMVRELRERGNVRFVLESPGREPASGTMYVSGSRMRVELANGDVVVVDTELRRTVLLKPATKQVIAGDNSGRFIDLYGLLLQLADAPRMEDLGVELVEGHAAEKFRVHLPPSMGALPEAVAVVWLDVSTKLPLRVEIPVRENSGESVVFREFAFDIAMSEGLFDTNPAGYVPFAPLATTTAIGLEMGMKIRNLGMAFHMYMQDHGEKIPETIEQLAPYLEAGGLRSSRNPDEPVGYVYIKPRLPLNGADVLAYERFAGDADHVWVVLVEGSAHVKTRAELEALLRETRGE
jgi:hypothetical protein